jgi:hypothetical protein
VTTIEDPAEARQLKRQAARIYLESAAVAVSVLGLSMIARSFVGT